MIEPLNLTPPSDNRLFIPIGTQGTRCQCGVLCVVILDGSYWSAKGVEIKAEGETVVRHPIFWGESGRGQEFERHRC